MHSTKLITVCLVIFVDYKEKVQNLVQFLFIWITLLKSILVIGKLVLVLTDFHNVIKSHVVRNLSDRLS